MSKRQSLNALINFREVILESALFVMYHEQNHYDKMISLQMQDQGNKPGNIVSTGVLFLIFAAKTYVLT